jgi:hypothetical protein
MGRMNTPWNISVRYRAGRFGPIKGSIWRRACTSKRHCGGLIAADIISTTLKCPVGGKNSRGVFAQIVNISIASKQESQMVNEYDGIIRAGHGG